LINYYTNKASITYYFSSLQELEPVQTPTYTTRKPARNSKLRNVPSLVSAYRPLSGSGTTRHKKSLRPKQEPVSPVMSGYGVSWCYDSCCISNHLQWSVPLRWRSGQLQLRYFCVSNSSPTVHSNTSQSVLRTISMLPATTIPDHPGLLRTASSRCHCWLPSTSRYRRL
jgi:hypothetical protein